MPSPPSTSTPQAPVLCLFARTSTVACSRWAIWPPTTVHAPTVGLFKADVPDPQVGAIVTVETAGGPEVFILEAPDAVQDESLSRWVVSHG